MQIVTADFESFYSTECSVSKLSPLEYINHRDFEVHSVALKMGEEPTFVVFGEDDVRHALNEANLSKAAALAHNMSGFDSYLMAYFFGIKPKMWLDTMAMARPIHAKTTGIGLGKLVEHYRTELEAMGIRGVKDNSVLVETKGRRLSQFTPTERSRMAVYNADDTDQCYGLFKILRKHYKPEELWQIDALIRMRTEPEFVLDRPLLEVALSVERDRKFKTLLELAKRLAKRSMDSGEDHDSAIWETRESSVEFVRANLASTAKFTALLKDLGVDVPMKESKTREGVFIPALSKTDQPFLDMLESEDELVAMAAMVRLDVKSTLLETRIGKLLTAANNCDGRLPIPLRYCGADTTGRDSGEEFNPQNFPAIRGAPKPSDAIRNAIGAPPGHVIMVADQSGIELRVNHFLWKVPFTMKLYAENPAADLYRAAAAVSYKCSPDDITKVQRQFQKVKELGLGFGAGGPTFQQVAKIMGGITLTESEATAGVWEWREQYPEIVRGWRTCHASLNLIHAGVEDTVDPWGLVQTCRQGLLLPTGRLIRYPHLRQEASEKDGRPEWVYAHGRHKARIYAGKVTENIVQALARDSIFEVAIKFFKLTGLRPKLRVHDELVYVVPQEKAEELLALLQNLMRQPPSWWPQLVTWSEGDIAPTYGAAK